MSNRIIDRLINGPAQDPELVASGLAGSRAQSLHRLQIGLTGIIGIILLVALADALRTQADETDAVAVPEAVTPVETAEEAGAQSDPLAEAGVVPDLPADNAEAAAQSDPVLPERGAVAQPAQRRNAPTN